ncbi:hypothetical protein ACH436_12435 [Isoptericola sp. NPDC019693]|uniref:hypothetical protein n=1 Tax=Isoptericola sp. NPDC019693 TaxID=3364009 RepID=UPI0037B12DAD
MTSTKPKGPAATGPLNNQSRGNGSSNTRTQKEHAMSLQITAPDNFTPYATVEVRSTTGAAPIKFRRVGGNDVVVELEDGVTQAYDRRNLLLVVLGLYEDDGEATAEQLVAVAHALGLKGSDVVPDDPAWRLRWTGRPDAH